jgi:murein DD-endopeptidase MepM/ murein hydrolase activator NlpD
MKIKRFWSVAAKNLITFSLLITVTLGYPLFSYSADLKSQLKETQSQKEEFIQKENQAKEEAQTLAERIANMNEQIKQINKEVKRTKKEVVKVKREISRATLEIKEQEKELIKQNEALDQALLYLYQEKDTPLLYQLFSFDTFSRVLDRQEYISVAQAKVSDTIEEVSQLKENLEEKRESLINDRQEFKELNVLLKSSKKSIKEEQKEKEKLLKETEGREDKYQMLVAAKKAEEDNILRKVQGLDKASGGKHYDGSKNKDDSKKDEKDNKDEKYQDSSYIWPIKIVGDYRHQVGQYYGMTDYAKSGAYNGAPHNGIDLSSISNKNGSLDLRVRSVMRGEVIMVTNESISGGWGNAVVIAHPNGLFTLYAHLAHLDKELVREGQKVKQGQMIGIEGNTGASTGRHLHFSVYMRITIYKTDWYYGPGYDYQWTLDPLKLMPI